MKGLVPCLDSIQPSQYIDYILKDRFSYEATSFCSVRDIIDYLPDLMHM